jgi:parallel beta-helix repeat protein
VAIETRSSGPVVSRNTIHGGLDGILVADADPWLMGNTIEGASGTAIAVGSGSEPKVVGNELCDNGVGLDIAPGAGSTVGGNSICSDAEIRTWNVAQDGSGDFSTIGEAVDAATDGDAILVHPGIYDESIVLGKDISITGQGDRSEVVVEVSAPFPESLDSATMDRLNYKDPPFAFWMVESDAVLENMTIRGRSSTIIVAGGAPTLSGLELDGLGYIFRPPGMDLIPFMGLSFEDGSTATLRDSIIEDTELWLRFGADVRVTGNTFTGGSITIEDPGTDPIVTGNRLQDSNKWGIAVWSGASPLIADNEIIRATTGIDVHAVTNPVIKANNIHDEEGLVDLVARADAGDLPDVITHPEIRGNRVRQSSVAGISVWEYASATIESNEVRGNSVGISLVRPGALGLTDNLVFAGLTGIEVRDSSPPLDGNTVEGAVRYGIDIKGDSSPVLTDNTVCDNEQNLNVADTATPVIDASNEICEDAPAE